MIIQACLNGARPSAYHPKLPITPIMLAQDGAACIAAGASELHIHPRGIDERETLDADTMGRALSALRRACPKIPIGVSTGAWIEGSLARTLAAIASWRELPDYASVNLSEDGASTVMDALWHRGVDVEAGIASIDDVQRLLDLGLSRRVLRVLIEIEEQDETSAIAASRKIEATLSAAGDESPRLLHGFDKSVWALVDIAFHRCFSTRIGLEDGDKLPDGTTASSNEALVRAAMERQTAGARQHGDRPLHSAPEL